MRPPFTLLLSFCIALPASTIAASPGVADADSSSRFWEITESPKDRYAQYMNQADQNALASALPLSGLEDDRRLLRFAENAISAYELAIEADPSQGEPHYRAVEIIKRYYLGGDISPRSQLRRAIGHLRAFIRKAPDDPRLLLAYNDLSVNLTKLYGLELNKSELEEAIASYDNELGLLNHAGPYEAGFIATLLSNRAEVHMMLGRLSEAIAGYESSIEFSDDPLAGYGLAVALDRDGQRTRARSIAKLYAEGDSGNRLVVDGTFFVPHGELYYYQAMRLEGLGAYRNAVAAYREYLRLLPNSQFAPMARRNLAELLPKAAKEPVASSPQNKRKRTW